MDIPWWAGAVVLIMWLTLTRVGRTVGTVILALLVAFGLYRVFFRAAGECAPLGLECRRVLQPRWAGPCLSSSGGAIGLEDGHYMLITDGTVPASATCFDVRFYR